MKVNRVKEMKNRTIKTLLIFASVSILSSCNNLPKSETTKAKSDTILSNNSDSIEITALIRNAYKWYETVDSINKKPDFYLSFKDTLLTGINWKEHEKRLTEITKTNFFTKEFLDNYNKIALQIDSIIKFSKTKYDIYLIPPFVPDANQWCKCQMISEKYWENITMINYKNNGNSASFKWSFGGDHSYNVETRKEDGKWKISYLEGFDKKNYTE